MTSFRLRRTARALGVTAVGAVSVLMVSGCLSVTADLEIDSNAKTSGTVSVALQKSTMSLFGMTLEDFSSALDDSDMSRGDTDGVDMRSCKASETSTEFVLTCGLSGDASSLEDGWDVARSGDSITFVAKKDSVLDPGSYSGSSGLNDLLSGAGGPLAGVDELLGGNSGLASGLADISSGVRELLAGATYTVNVQFPGEITSISGEGITQTSATSVSISIPLTSAVDVSVTSNATAGGGGSSLGTVLLIVAVAVLGVAVIVLLALLLLLRRRTGATPDNAAPDSATPNA